MCSIYHGAVIYPIGLEESSFLYFFGFLCITRARRHDPRSGSKTFRRKKENVFHQQRERERERLSGLRPWFIPQQKQSSSACIERKCQAEEKEEEGWPYRSIDTANGIETPACGWCSSMWCVPSDETVSEKYKEEERKGGIETKPSPHPAQSDCFLIPSSSSARDHVILSYVLHFGVVWEWMESVLYLILFQSSSRRCTSETVSKKYWKWEVQLYFFPNINFPLYGETSLTGIFQGYS